jgi:hypothetical protein
VTLENGACDFEENHQTTSLRRDCRFTASGASLLACADAATSIRAQSAIIISLVEMPE